MGTETVLQVENISKLYRLGVIGSRTVSEDLSRWWHRIRGKEDPFLKIESEKKEKEKSGSELLWALKDINFEVKQGEAIGIIGKNGSGKSTLLKILSRITQPTTGEIRINGRIGSLLEVGTGFHPDLTGRENIFMNGTILGMKKWEIKNRFDEIVGFSGIEKFIDTPVKRYSSGMYVRLAFSVASHLKSEILILDEVLSVGDAEFQKKCLLKMEEVNKKEGRTVIFVSHSMQSVSRLCDEGIFLNDGRIHGKQPIEKAVEVYEETIFGKVSSPAPPPGYWYINTEQNNSEYFIKSIRTFDTNGNSLEKIKTYHNFKIEIIFNSPEFVSDGSINLFLKSVKNDKILRLSTLPDQLVDFPFKKGENKITCVIKKLPLPEGKYILEIALAVPLKKWLFKNESLAKFDIEASDIFNSHYPPNQRNSLAVTDYTWEL